MNITDSRRDSANLAIDVSNVTHLRNITALKSLFNQFNGYLQCVSDALQMQPTPPATQSSSSIGKVGTALPSYTSAKLGKKVYNDLIAGGNFANDTKGVLQSLHQQFSKLSLDDRDVSSYINNYGRVRNSAIGKVKDILGGVNDQRGVIAIQDKIYGDAVRRLQQEIHRLQTPHPPTDDLDKQFSSRRKAVATAAHHATNRVLLELKSAEEGINQEVKRVRIVAKVVCDAIAPPAVTAHGDITQVPDPATQVPDPLHLKDGEKKGAERLKELALPKDVADLVDTPTVRTAIANIPPSRFNPASLGELAGDNATDKAYNLTRSICDALYSSPPAPSDGESTREEGYAHLQLVRRVEAEQAISEQMVRESIFNKSNRMVDIGEPVVVKNLNSARREQFYDAYHKYMDNPQPNALAAVGVAIRPNKDAVRPTTDSPPPPVPVTTNSPSAAVTAKALPYLVDGMD